MSVPGSVAFLTDIFNTLSSFQGPGLPERQRLSNGQGNVNRPGGFNQTLPSNSLLDWEARNRTQDGARSNSLKDLFSTLHLFFPNELLPALDLLDRGLVSRLMLVRTVEEQDQEISVMNHDGLATGALGTRDVASNAAHVDHWNGPQAWYSVQSSSAAASRLASRNQNQPQQYQYQTQSSPQRGEQFDSRYQQRNSTRAKSYEVCLTAWNCSCPAFAFDAVSSFTEGRDVWERRENHKQIVYEELGSADWVYGGLRMLNGADVMERQVPACKHLLACLLVDRCPILRDSVSVKELSGDEMAGWSAGWGD